MQLCGEMKIKCLDLLPVFRKYKEQKLFRDNDFHLNTTGNKIAVEQIVDFLLQKH